jgi:tetratricopeptide (TPR) repeat protein
LLYISLRNRGIQKIAQQADLEGGTYDLALAARFGPLDVEDNNWRDWAVLYTRGASFWDVDWEQAVYYFSQLAQIAPNLMDASRLTAVERYRLALIGFGDWLARQERWCEAEEQYEIALEFQSNTPVEPTESFASEQCANPTSEPGIFSGEVTLTPTLPIVEVTPTLESTPEPSLTPPPTEGAAQPPVDPPPPAP